MKTGIIKKITLITAIFSLIAALFVSSGYISGGLAAGGAQETATASNYFLSDYQSKAELKAESNALSRQISQEGIVMLKNEGDALPLKQANPRISVFGKNSTVWDVFSASEFEGKGFSLNPTLRSFYGDASRSGSGVASMEHGNYTLSGLPTGETPISMLTSDTAVTGSYSSYNDAALVYFFRGVGEGRDAPRTMLWDGESYKISDKSTQTVSGAASGDDHYMELDLNERALLGHVCGNFDKVIVVMISGAQMETDFLDDPAYNGKIKAAFWAGTNANGYSGLAEIIKGEVSPSGRTTDTWYRDFSQDPTWQNFGNNRVLDGNRYANLSAGSDTTNRYVIYKEGIYLGYRYYETRGYTEKEADSSSTWYEDNVAFPFGYGLSYTDFEWELVSSVPTADSTLEKDGTVSVTVKVTNTGNVPSKDVVQLYYTAPYTSGGIEKSHVVLGGFEKTELLAPNECQEVTITLSVKDMASYDWSDANTNGFKGYELDEGAYSVRLMRNAHDEALCVNYTVASNIQYPAGVSGDANNDNLFEGVSEYLTESVGEEYMSRADFENTFPTMSIGLNATQEIIDGLGEWTNRAAAADKNHSYYTETMPTLGENNGIVLSDLYRKEYDDPMWDDFLDQLTESQLVALATQGNYWSGIDIPTLGVKKVVNTDGVGGLFLYDSIHVPVIGSTSNQSWGAQVNLAASWNKELAYAKGRIIGNEGLWGGSDDYSMIPGYYAPGVNIHRSPFGGRNKQYFSEDGLLTGKMAAQLVRGAKAMGMFTYVKHFAINEQETNRIGVTTWANEQSMREIYFKGFELCVTEGKTTAMMSSLNRIGYEWAGGSHSLLTKLLREEWGFRGSVVTDSFIGGMSNADQMIRAGGNLALGVAGLNYNKGTPTTVAILREMAHGLLYTHANSMAINAGARPVVPSRLSSYVGGILPTGAIGTQYSANTAKAAINPDFTELSQSDVNYVLADDSLPLPAGLTLDSSGSITGIPEEPAENYRITVSAICGEDSLTATFILNITTGDPEIIYSSESPVMPAATIGRAYAASVATAEIFAPHASEEEIEAFPNITYALKNGSALPVGLRLTSTGNVVGVPSEQCDSYSFEVVALADGLTSKSFKFTVTVNDSLTFDSKTLSVGKFGAGYFDCVQPAVSSGKVTYALKEGSALPNGLALTACGYIVGKPTQTVTNHTFTVLAVCPTAETTEAQYSITIGLGYGSVTLPDAEAGLRYDTRVDTAQGAGTVTYSLKAGSVLPDGLTLTSDGIIGGTPTKAGAYEVTIVASADGKAGDEVTLTLFVAGTLSEANVITDGAVVWFSLMLCFAAVAVMLCALLIVKSVKKSNSEGNDETRGKK